MEKKEKRKLTPEQWIGGIMLLIMFIIMFVNVVTRYLIKVSIAFTEELVTYLFIAATIFGASQACKENANMGMDAVVKLLPKKVQVVIQWIVAVFTIAMFVILIYYSILIVKNQIKYESITPQMRLPQWIFTVPLPIGACFFIFRTVQYTLKFTKENWKEEGK